MAYFTMTNRKEVYREINRFSTSNRFSFEEHIVRLKRNLCSEKTEQGSSLEGSSGLMKQPSCGPVFESSFGLCLWVIVKGYEMKEVKNRKDCHLKPLWYDIDDLTVILRWGKTKIREVINSGALPSKKIDGKVLVLVEDVEAFVRRFPLQFSSVELSA